MKYETVLINGIEMPISFGMSMLFHYERETGRSYADAMTQLEKLPITTLLELIYFGLKDGHRKKQEPFDYSMDDLADWFDEDPAAMERCQAIFSSSQMQGSSENTEENGEQKKTVSTGTN